MAEQGRPDLLVRRCVEAAREIDAPDFGAEHGRIASDIQVSWRGSHFHRFESAERPGPRRVRRPGSSDSRGRPASPRTVRRPARFRCRSRSRRCPRSTDCRADIRGSSTLTTRGHARIVADEHEIRAGVVLSPDDIEQRVRVSVVELAIGLGECPRKPKLVSKDSRGLERANGRAAQDQRRPNIAGAKPAPHARRVALAAACKRPVVVGRGRVAPA